MYRIKDPHPNPLPQAGEGVFHYSKLRARPWPLGAVLPADKQMPITIHMVNTSHLPSLDNLEWVNEGIPYRLLAAVICANRPASSGPIQSHLNRHDQQPRVPGMFMR